MKYRLGSKEYKIQNRLRVKKYICVSKKWIKWAKRYTNRASRRKEKMKDYEV